MFLSPQLILREDLFLSNARNVILVSCWWVVCYGSQHWCLVHYIWLLKHSKDTFWIDMREEAKCLWTPYTHLFSVSFLHIFLRIFFFFSIFFTRTFFLTFRIPFVSDQLNHQIRLTRALAKHDIPARLVNPRGRTIRDLTRLPDATPDKICHSKSCPAPGICQQSNATCILCGEFCVGMTTRKLHDRAREHVLSASKRNNNTALGDH